MIRRTLVVGAFLWPFAIAWGVVSAVLAIPVIPTALATCIVGGAVFMATRSWRYGR